MNNDILLVDDEPGTIQLLGGILADLGNLRFATCGVDALRLAREERPDLILLDTQMPGMSGFQVCEALKADPELADVPVMVVTASAEISKGNSTCGRIQQEQHEMTASPRKIEPSRALAQP